MSVEENWPFEKVIPEDQDAVADLIAVIEDELAYTTSKIDELAKQRDITTATGRSLEKLAGEVGIYRAVGESDERLRFRTQIAKTVTESNRNIYEVATLLESLFGDDVSRIEVGSSSDEPIVTIALPDDLIEGMPLTLAEFRNEIDQLAPAGDKIAVESSSTFAFAGGTSGSGFDDGEWK